MPKDTFDPSQGAVNAATTIQVSTDACEPNPWNYNAQSTETFAKLVASIRKHGYVQPAVVREMGEGRYQILGGEHGWRAAIELNMPEISIVNLGVVPDARAKELSILLNELHGDPDQVRLADVLRDITRDQDVQELLATLPYTSRELSMYVEAVDFGYANLSTADLRVEKPDEAPPEEAEVHPDDIERGGGAPSGAKTSAADPNKPRVVLRAFPLQAAEIEAKLALVDKDDPVRAVITVLDAYLAPKPRPKKPASTRKKAKPQ
jgi:ParB-like chromosome segregation protein Spo0J